jgi:hypothetical protein
MSKTKEELQKKYDGNPIDLTIIKVKKNIENTLFAKSILYMLSNCSILDIKNILEIINTQIQNREKDLVRSLNETLAINQGLIAESEINYERLIFYIAQLEKDKIILTS